MEASALAESIVNHEELSTPDLINTLLMYLATLTMSGDEKGYEHYALCKPALLRLHGEDAVGFLRVAKKIKERLGITTGAITRDIELLSTAPALAQQAQAAPPPGLVVRLAAAILETDHFAQDAGRKLFMFSDGVYKPLGEQHILRRVKELLTAWEESNSWSSYRAREVVEYIRIDAPQLWERPPLDTINVLNGLLNVEMKELRPHSPDWLSPIQLPVTYDPAAKCPQRDRFVKEVFPKDARKLAYEIPADLMVPDRSEQKAILLSGEGGNGKSTYLTAVTNFIGRRNVASLSLQKLETDRFAAARLVGKLANICPDLPSSHLASTAAFKAVTGGDVITGECKYLDSFDFVPYVRLVFAANHPPHSGDDSEAFFKRWRVVPFERIFRGTRREIPRRKLDARLADPRELSGVLNKALAVLPTLRRRGFSESPTMRKAWEEFRQTTDPLAVWLEQETIEHPDALVAKSTLRAAYNANCKQHGRPPLTEQAFGRAFKQLRPRIKDAQRTIAGELTWAWLGLGLKITVGPSPSKPSRPLRDPGDSRDSRDSRDSSYLLCGVKKYISEGTEGEKGEAAKNLNSQNNNRGKPVNRVNGVNGGARAEGQAVLREEGEL